jgi:hypothetical protein
MSLIQLLCFQGYIPGNVSITRMKKWTDKTYHTYNTNPTVNHDSRYKHKDLLSSPRDLKSDTSIEGGHLQDWPSQHTFHPPRAEEPANDRQDLPSLTKGYNLKAPTMACIAPHSLMPCTTTNIKAIHTRGNMHNQIVSLEAILPTNKRRRGCKHLQSSSLVLGFHVETKPGGWGRCWTPWWGI